ncbi:MAG: hypothetical protein N2746_03520 [Deltaproteobacteria bacterium]|nr:hypothetical protein [Deltaproteobacteria bacterium]
MEVRRLKPIVVVMVVSVMVYGGCSRGGGADTSSDIVLGRDGLVGGYCDGETGRYPSWDLECRGNVGCSVREVGGDGGCSCGLCRDEECVRIVCRGDGMRDAVGEDVVDGGCDLDIKIYPDILEPDCEFVPDLEGEVVDYIDLNRPINFIGRWSIADLNDNNDLLLCIDKGSNFCKEIYYIALNESPIKMRKVPTCMNDYSVFVWEFSLCNGREKIVFPLSIYTNDLYDMGVIEYDKKTGEIIRHKTPEGIYSAEELKCQDDNVFVYQDAPSYEDCEGVDHIISYFFYFNRNKGIHKRIKLPMIKSLREESGEKYYFERDLFVVPYVWNEYVVYTSPLGEEDEYKRKNCIWRYNVDTDEREAFFCNKYLHSEYTWYPASNVSDYRIAMTIYSEVVGYPRGVLIINFKTGEITHIPLKYPHPVVRLFKNLMLYEDEGEPYIYDFETRVSRRIVGEYSEYFRNAERMNYKYILSAFDYGSKYLVDMEKLGIVKDGHVVPE